MPEAHPLVRFVFEILRLDFKLPAEDFVLMKYSRFEELPVWKDAIELAVRVYRFTTQAAFRGRYSLKQLIRQPAVPQSAIRQ